MGVAVVLNYAGRWDGRLATEFALQLSNDLVPCADVSQRRPTLGIPPVQHAADRLIYPDRSADDGEPARAVGMVEPRLTDRKHEPLTDPVRTR